MVLILSGCAALRPMLSGKMAVSLDICGRTNTRNSARAGRSRSGRSLWDVCHGARLSPGCDAATPCSAASTLRQPLHQLASRRDPLTPACMPVSL